MFDMKIVKTITLLLISVVAIGQKTEILSAKQIVDSSVVFCGGEQGIDEIKSSSMNYLLIQPDKSTAIITEKRKTGQKYVQSVLSMQHTPQTTFFDGNILSRVDATSVTKVKTLESMEEVKLRTFNQIQYAYKVLDYELTRLADKKFNNFDCYVISAKAANGYSTINFFDKTNYRLLMVAYPNGNKSLMIEYIYKDGVLFNSVIINTFTESKEKQVLKLQHVHLNVKISDLWFKCPYSDKVYIPPHITTGEFESTNGVKSVFVRTEKAQDYIDEKGNITSKRLLKWNSEDSYGLIDDKAIKNKDTSPESQILVRIISWDDDEYVCHWISDKYTDTQDYKIKE
jgi:hypothetical protein